MEAERVVWEGRPSPLEHAVTFAVCGMLVWLVVPVLIAVWRYLEQRCTRYTLTNERLTVSTGVLSKRIDELELYRVKDTRLEVPFLLRMFGLAHVVLYTSDRSAGITQLRAVPDAEMLRNQIRSLVEKRREEKGVRELDV
jgi:membrane protein YdbS with pleckstrin-like domain